jgi:hypothetical protein
MILDELNEFADATVLSTAATGRALVGDQIPLSVARDIGNGEPVYLVIGVDTAVTSTGAATVSFELVSDDSAAISTSGAATVHLATEAIPVASLVAGYQRAFALPMELPVYEGFLGIIANVASVALSGGKINAFLTKDVAKWKSTADAI